MTDSDIAEILQDLENGSYHYMFVRSEPVVENCVDLTNRYILQDIYYSDGSVSMQGNSNTCFGIKVDGHECYWYNYYD